MHPEPSEKQSRELQVAAQEPMRNEGIIEEQVVERAAMQAAPAGLASKEKVCLLLMNVQGFTAAEAAQILGDSPQAVAKRSLAHEERLQDRVWPTSARSRRSAVDAPQSRMNHFGRPGEPPQVDCCC